MSDSIKLQDAFFEAKAQGYDYLLHVSYMSKHDELMLLGGDLEEAFLTVSKRDETDKLGELEGDYLDVRVKGVYSLHFVSFRNATDPDFEQQARADFNAWRKAADFRL